MRAFEAGRDASRRHAAVLPYEGSLIRLVGAVPKKGNDGWRLQHRNLSIEAPAETGASGVGEGSAPGPPGHSTDAKTVRRPNSGKQLGHDLEQLIKSLFKLGKL